MRETGPDLVRQPRSVLTTGTFDGVHLGHQAILGYLVARARETGGVPTVVTFDPHPRAVLAGADVPLLTTLDEREAALAELGVERFVVLPFTRELAALEPEDYVRDVLVGAVGMREIVVGYDHRFGRRARGDRALLEALGAELGFAVDGIPEHIESGVTVSSSEIRRLLAAGEARAAARLLGRPYRLTGRVVPGAGRGRTIGVPTANVEPEDPRKLIPRPGVYAVRARVDGADVRGMMNVGRRPTFEADGALKAEVHLLDWSGDLYGHALGVDVVARIREERAFDGPEALVAQIGEDRAEADRLLDGLV